MSGSEIETCPYCNEITGTKEKVDEHAKTCQAKIQWQRESDKWLREFRDGFLKNVEAKVKERMATLSSAAEEEEPIVGCVYCGGSWGNKVELHDHHLTCSKKVVYENMILEFKKIIQGETGVHVENEMNCVYCSNFTGSKDEVHGHEFLCPKKPAFERFILKWQKVTIRDEVREVTVINDAITLEEVYGYMSDRTLDIKVLMRRFCDQYPEAVKEIPDEKETNKADEERRIRKLKADEERRIQEWKEQEELIQDRIRGGVTSTSDHGPNSP